MSKHHVLPRAAAALGVAALTTLTLGTGFASAHVVAHAPEAAKGGFSKITFSVPNEEKTANTVKVEVDFPKDHPVASVSTKPMPGWTAQITKVQLAQPIKVDNAEVKEAVARIVWTADPGTKIAPGQFNEFDVSAGPLPDNTDQLVIPAVQTYDDGTVVKWDEPQVKGQPEPEHPAPTVALAAKSADADMPGMPAASGAPEPAAASADTTARWLGGAGLAIGVLGLGAGITAAAGARRTNRPTDDSSS